MKLLKKVLITIGRQYGSGGHAIAEKLGQELEIPFYDRNMIAMIAKKHGLDEEALHLDDEKLSSPFLDPYFSYGVDTASRSSRLYSMQAEIIREQADKGSAIFVGRCADDVLRDYENLVNIFIFAPREDRLKRLMDTEGITDPAAIDRLERRVEKARRAYYQFYTDQRWGDKAGKDLMINSSALGYDGTAELILNFLKMKGYAED